MSRTTATFRHVQPFLFVDAQAAASDADKIYNNYIPHKCNSVGCDGQVQFGNVQSARNAGRQWPDDNHFENPVLRGYRILIVPESHPVVLHLISSNANDGPGHKSRGMNWRWREIIWSSALGTPEREKVENNSQL